MNSDDYQPTTFNFWPSFSDIMLSVVLVLLLVLFLIAAVISIGTLNLKPIKEKQEQLIANIVADLKGELISDIDDKALIDVNADSAADIIITNDKTLQNITFSDNILFSPDSYFLNNQGKILLNSIGSLIKVQLPFIREIQIQGHADILSTTKHGSNLRLAALRAEQVFLYFQNNIGLDPAQNMMSISSYGEYKPINRSGYDSNYSRVRLEKDNSTKELRSLNRRIELLLFYR